MSNQTSFSDNAPSVVKAIQDGVETAVITIEGIDFTTRPVFLPPAKETIDFLQISSLDGLAEYINQNIDEKAIKNLLIVINSPRSVSVYEQADAPEGKRLCWLDADYQTDGFPFERFLDHEEFMVKVQALIVPDEADITELLALVGNIKAAAVQTSLDDGVSQTVTIEKGVRKSEVDLPNPVRLAPRRTFPEVVQPVSPFVLRVKQPRDGAMPEIALFEADGGLWKIQAIASIKEYLNEKLKEDIPVIG